MVTLQPRVIEEMISKVNIQAEPGLQMKEKKQKQFEQKTIEANAKV